MNKKTLSLKDNVLGSNFGNLKSRKYAISVKYFDADNSLPSKRIDYKVKIFLTPNHDSYLLDIDKYDFWFDGHEPDLINELIARDLSEIIYPVQLRTNEKGSFLGITNFDQMVNNRWNIRKNDITGKYTTKIAENFYEAFERNLKSRRIFEKSMENDWFWNLFFHPKYIRYEKEYSIETDLYLAVIPYDHPIKFKGRQRINPEITDYHSVEIQFRSYEILAPEYFVPNNFTFGNVFIRLNVYFDVDVYHLFPMHTRAYFEVYSKDSEEKETLIRRIEFTQYQEDTENNKTAPPEKKSPFLIDEEDEKEIYKIYEGKNYTYQEWKKFKDEQYKIYTDKKTKKSFWDFLG